MAGLGFIGATTIVEERHAPEAVKNPDMDIVGFYNRSPERAQAFARKFGGKPFADIDTMLCDARLDAVVISSVNRLHAPHAMQALEKGKHVLLEKPMALSVKEAQAMLDLARIKGVVLMVGHNMRLEPVFRRAKQILDGGELGRVISFDAQVGSQGPDFERGCAPDGLWFYDKEAAGMGVMGDLGVHSVDTLHYLLGEEFCEVSCFAGAAYKTYSDGSPISVEDSAVCLLKTAGGVLGSLSASWNYYDGWTSAITLFCEKGVLRLNQLPGCPIVITYATGRLRHESPHSSEDSGVMRMFADAVKSGRLPELDGRVGVASLEVCLAALRSAREARPIKL